MLLAVSLGLAAAAMWDPPVLRLEVSRCCDLLRGWLWRSHEILRLRVRPGGRPWAQVGGQRGRRAIPTAQTTGQCLGPPIVFGYRIDQTQKMEGFSVECRSTLMAHTSLWC